jgi:hypothetical protein
MPWVGLGTERTSGRSCKDERRKAEAWVGPGTGRTSGRSCKDERRTAEALGRARDREDLRQKLQR